MIRVSCEGCGKELVVKESLAGKRGKCPGCGEQMMIPEPDPVFDFAPEPAPSAPVTTLQVQPVPSTTQGLARWCLVGGMFCICIVAALAVGYIAGREVTLYHNRSFLVETHQRHMDGIAKAYESAGAPPIPKASTP